MLTWLLGIPSSSSHALVGGLVGAGVVGGRASAPIVASGVLKTAAFIFLAPIFGMLLAILLVIITSWLFKPVARDHRRTASSAGSSCVSAAAYSLGHGGNDAQKTMGIIAVLLFSQGMLGATSTSRSGW